MKSKTITELTAHTKSATRIKESLKIARFDAASFEVGLTPCQGGLCKGTCCSHGFYPEADEEADLLAILAEKENDLVQLGVKKPAEWIVDEEHPEFGSVRRIALQPRPFSKMVENFPKHFPDTACCLLLENGHCALQTLAMNEGKHKWFYKPILCALFPIIVDENDTGDITVMIYDQNKDTEQRTEYIGFNNDTACGKTCAIGSAGSVPASVVVK